MSDLTLRPLKCPQCGAPGVVRRGTRITNCERCGVRLCLTEVATSKYEVSGTLSPGGALNAARSWMEGRSVKGNFGRPELVLIPFHEVSSIRVGVYERTVPERLRAKRVQYSSGDGGAEPVDWVYAEKEDTKVMIADVQHLQPAAQVPWDLSEFDAREARRSASLQPFDLVEAQRRATVYAEEETALGAAERRFSQGSEMEVVPLGRRTLFFPFWSIPVETTSGSFQIVLDGVNGAVVAWRLPRPFPRAAAVWALLAIPGAFALGHGINALFLGGSSPLDPFAALLLGALATGAALWKANHPDWALVSWPG